MNVTKYTDKRNTDPIKKGTLLFLNLRLTHNQEPLNYIAFFEKLIKLDPIINLYSNRHISIDSLYKDNLLDNNNLPRMLYGKISTYDILDKNGFYNRKKKEPVSVEIGEDIVANFKYIDFFFVPSRHRLAFFANQEITQNQVFNYFQKGADNVLGVEQMVINFETERDVIEKILNAKSIESFRAVVTYTNRDEISIFSDLLSEMSKEDNVNKLEIKATPPHREEMIPSDKGIIKATTELAQSYGFVEARVRTNEKSKAVTIKTAEHPLNLPIKTTLSMLKETIYSTIIGRFKHRNSQANNEREK